MHSAETCGRTTFLHILNSNKFYRLHVQTKISKNVVHICKNIINAHTKCYKSRNHSRNRSALSNMNFSAGPSRIESLSLVSESLWFRPSSLKVWMCVSRHLWSSSTVKWRITTKFGTNRTHHNIKS